jgi:hypothetical protein
MDADKFNEIVAGLEIPDITAESVFFDDVRAWMGAARLNLDSALAKVQEGIDANEPAMVLFFVAQYACHVHQEVPDMATVMSERGLLDDETIETAMKAAMAVVHMMREGTLPSSED